MRRLVIVGASLAGLRAAESARAAGFAGELTLIGGEPHAPYTRPPLSKELLRDATLRETIDLRHRVDAHWLLGRHAIGLDLAGQRVELDTGDSVPYDAVIIATGCSARRWSAHKPPPVQLHTLRTVDDALAFRAAVGVASRVLIVGAGFIGCEVAATLRSLGRDVTLVDIESRPMKVLGPEIGRLCAELHRAHGVNLRLDTGVCGFERRRRTLVAHLDDGSVVEADVCLIATGAVANTEWLLGSGVPLDSGVICDQTCAVPGAHGVFAAGDVARWPHPLIPDALVRVEHWSHAAEQGMIAGHNAVVDASERRDYAAVPSFWTDQYGRKIQSVGFPQHAESVRLSEGEFDHRFVMVGERHDRVVSAVAVDAPSRMVRYRTQLASSLAT
jgi:3-phenylpropionate/trans-cinnamate dioxygenase ferredoxin reductase component